MSRGYQLSGLALCNKAEERPKPRFNIVTMLSIKKILNAKVWKTIHAIDLDTRGICKTLPSK